MKNIITLTFSAIFFFSVFCNAQSDSLIKTGKVKQKSINHAGAIIDFTSAIKQNEAPVQKYLAELEAYDKISPFDKAEKGIEAPVLDVNFAIPYYLRGLSYSATESNAEAMNDFNTAIKINSKLGAAYFERGKILWSTGKKDEGCLDLGMAGSLNDSSAKEMFDDKFCWKEAVAAYNDASTKIRLNNFQGALDVIQTAIKLCPDSAGYLGLRGRAYLGLGKYDLSMQDFDKAISLNKNCKDALFGKGVAYYSKGKWQEAFDELAKLIQVDEKYSDAYLYRAYACEGMDKNTSALYDYQAVQRLKPGDGLAFFKSGLLRSSMNDPKACSDFKKAASLGNTDAQDYVEKCDPPKKGKK